PPVPEHPVGMPGPAPPSSLAPTDPAIDGRRAKRELSNSKRAAQNRAAQRAFRQRKEGYIKKLEQQVRDYSEMENQFKMLQTENYSLREYIVHLHARLVDAQVEPPQPPPNVNLNMAPGVPGPHAHALPPPVHDPVGSPPAEPTPNTGSATGAATLDAVAQAVQSLSRSEAAYKHQVADPESHAVEDQRTAEEISRQL
ncbi:hypothetical protein M406DRAFT_242601, partial [Cryphonectria parasitica EP155]